MMFSFVVLCMYLSVWIAASTSFYVYAVPIVPVEIFAVVAILFVGTVPSVTLYPCFRKLFSVWFRIESSGKAVLVTGSARGFGYQIAKRLDAKGFHVFASCRDISSQGARDLKAVCSNRLHLVQLDVTKEESVRNAFAYVKVNLHDLKLWAIVNNAGILKGLDIGLTPIKVFEDSIMTNALGVVRVTKEFLPLIMESKGRIVNISSITSRISLVHEAAYCMSKFAVRCFSEILRQELIEWGVKVIDVEPELFESSMTSETYLKSHYDEIFGTIDEDMKPYYDDRYSGNLSRVQTDIIDHHHSLNLKPVIDDVESAVTLLHPNRTYVPARNFIFRAIIGLMYISPKPILDIEMRIFYRVMGLKSPVEKPFNPIQKL